MRRPVHCVYILSVCVLLHGLSFKVSLFPSFFVLSIYSLRGKKGGGNLFQVCPACQYCPLSSLTNWTWNGWRGEAEGIRLGCLTLQWAALIWKGVKRQRGSCSESVDLIWKYCFGVLQIMPQKSLKNELIKWMSFLHSEGASKQGFLRGVLRVPGKSSVS